MIEILTHQAEFLKSNAVHTGYEPFFSTIKKAKLRVQRQKVVNGLVGLSNPTITIFDLKNNHGYKDKQEVDNTNRTVEPTQYVIVNDRNTNTSS